MPIPNKNLTAIKIPGKNTRSQPRATAGIASKRSTRPPGRRMKATRDLKTSRTTAASTTLVPAKQRKHRSLKHIKSKRSMSLLEKLPTELLERVFVFCFEPNLPRASPVIAAKLSSEHIYIKCVIAAFGPTWQKTWDRDFKGNSKIEVSSEPEYNEPSATEQSAILRCRWATLERLRNADQTWLRQKERELGTSSLSPDIHILASERYIPSFIRDFFDEDYEYFINEIPLRPFRRWEWAFLTRQRWPLLTFRYQTVEIPSSLLNGPWTEEKIKHLFYLVRAKAFIERRTSTAGEEAMEGLRSAILAGNIHAVYLLHRLNTRIPFTTTLITEFLSRNSDRLPKETMTAFVEYFKKNLTGKHVLGILDARGLSNMNCMRLEDDEENRRMVFNRRAEVELEVEQMKKQGARDGNQKLVEWADIIGMIYGHEDHDDDLFDPGARVRRIVQP